MSVNRLMKADLIKRTCIAPMELSYTPPKSPTLSDGTSNPAYSAIVEMYVDALVDFSEEVLAKGMKAFLWTWMYTRWPKIGEIRGIMIETEREIGAARALPPPKSDPQPKHPRSCRCIKCIGEDSYVLETRRLKAENDARDRATNLNPPSGLWSEMTDSQRARWRHVIPDNKPKLGDAA